jgi:hypothetical protein
MVTLYVGAASTPPGDDDSYERSTEAAMSSELAEPFVVESTPRQSAQTRRRRKPRPVERRPQISDSTDCVAPAMLPEADTTEYLVSHEGPSAATPGDDQLPEEDIDDGYGERRHHELVARVDDVFSGRAGAPWRRVYPVRRRAISFGNQHHRRWTR